LAQIADYLLSLQESGDSAGLVNGPLMDM